MPSLIPVPFAARTIAFRVIAAVVALSLLSLIVWSPHPIVVTATSSVAFAAASWLFATRADRTAHRADAMRQEGRRVLADHIRFAQELAVAVTLHPTDAHDPQMIRVEIVQLFFAHAGRLDVSKGEMEELLRDIDPIVVSDVVRSLEKSRSPLLDEAAVPWAAFAKSLARRHSGLCARPIQLLAWNRTLPRKPAVPET